MTDALAREFATHAEESLAIARETFATAAETWPDPGYWGCPKCSGRLEADGWIQPAGGVGSVRRRCPAYDFHPAISIFIGNANPQHPN